MAIAQESMLGGVTVERDVAAPMRDGTLLRADVYRPEGPGTFPVLVNRTPYDKRVAQGITYQHPAWYARQGYVVVVQDSRGRWASEGDWYPFLHEAQDGFDTVEWAARLPGAGAWRCTASRTREPRSCSPPRCARPA